MTTMHVMVLTLIFLAAAGLAWGVLGYLMPRPIDARLKQAAGVADFAPDDSLNVWQQKIVEAVSPAAKLSLPAEGWENSSFRRRFMHAGFRGEQAPVLFFAAKTLLALALPLGYMLATGATRMPATLNTVLMTVVGLAGLGYYLPNLYLRRRIAERQREIFNTFPDAIDLMTVAVEAGLGLDAAITRVSGEMGVKSRVLEEELRLVGLELRAGASREQALRNLALRTGVDEVNLFVAMLIQTDRFGTSMAESLRVHSDALRTKRRLRAEEAAAKIPVKLLFPLILCIFPSLMIVLMGPAVISIYRVFMPIATGN